jgi:hypothetical protein
MAEFVAFVRLTQRTTLAKALCDGTSLATKHLPETVIGFLIEELKTQLVRPIHTTRKYVFAVD